VVAVDLLLANEHPRISTPLASILTIGIDAHATLFSTTHFQPATGRTTISITYDAEKPKISPLLFKFTIEFAQVADDLPRAHATGIHRHDLVVEA
jgi:hypothetical protein